MELILIDEPGVFGPNHDTRPACLECLLPVATDGSAPLCDKCGLPLCNSDKCRSSEQTWHGRLECKLFQEPTPSGFKFRVKMDRPQWVTFCVPFRMTSIQGRVEYVRCFQYGRQESFHRAWIWMHSPVENAPLKAVRSCNLEPTANAYGPWRREKNRNRLSENVSGTSLSQFQIIEPDPEVEILVKVNMK